MSRNTGASKVLAASPDHPGPLAWEMSCTSLEDPKIAKRESDAAKLYLRLLSTFDRLDAEPKAEM